jgi:hypothetical protein
MTDAADITRWTGTFVAVVGAIAVSPAASFLALAAVTGPLRRAARAGGSRFMRWTPWLPWPVRSVTTTRSTARATLVATATVTASGSVSSPTGSTASKIEQLNKDMDELRRGLAEDLARTSARLGSHDTELADLAQHLEIGLAVVQDRQAEVERRSTETDARALPLVGVGVVLSSAPEILAWLPVWALSTVLVGIVAAALNVARAAWRDRTRSA